MDIQERLTAFAMLGAGWVMWLLVALSVICLAIILERTYYLVASRDDARRLQDGLRKSLDEGDIDGAMKVMAGSKSWEARILAAGLGEASRGPGSVEEKLAGERGIARARMERNLAFLGTVGNNAPFVGLLGTVIGIIRSFQALNESQGQVTTELMAEVGEALVATAIGLLVALPAVAFYNAFQRAIKSRLTNADAMGRDLLAYVKGQKPGGGYRGTPEAD